MCKDLKSCCGTDNPEEILAKCKEKGCCDTDKLEELLAKCKEKGCCEGAGNVQDVCELLSKCCPDICKPKEE